MGARSRRIAWNSSADESIQCALERITSEVARMNALKRRISQEATAGPLADDDAASARRELAEIEGHRRDLRWVKRRLERIDRRYGTIFEMRYMGDCLWDTVCDCIGLSRRTVFDLHRDMLDALRADPEAVAVMNGEAPSPERDG